MFWINYYVFGKYFGFYFWFIESFVDVMFFGEVFVVDDCVFVMDGLQNWFEVYFFVEFFYGCEKQNINI